MSEHIGGSPRGPRGVFDKLSGALRSIGAPKLRDDSLGIEGYTYLSDDNK